jgi:hypothetical protein
LDGSFGTGCCWSVVFIPIVINQASSRSLETTSHNQPHTQNEENEVENGFGKTRFWTEAMADAALGSRTTRSPDQKNPRNRTATNLRTVSGTPHKFYHVTMTSGNKIQRTIIPTSVRSIINYDDNDLKYHDS